MCKCIVKKQNRCEIFYEIAEPCPENELNALKLAFENSFLLSSDYILSSFSSTVSLKLKQGGIKLLFGDEHSTITYSQHHEPLKSQPTLEREVSQIKGKNDTCL